MKNNSEKTVKQKSFEIFLAYGKSMLFAFTGGAVTLPLLQEELDNKYNLMTSQQVLEYFAIGQAIPGTISLSTGILIGRHIAGWPGAIAASLGVILPALISMLIIAMSYNFLSKIEIINKAINGIRAASVAIILTNAILIIKTNKENFYFLLMIFALIGSFVFKINVVFIILFSGIIGVIYYVIKNKRSN